MKRLSLAAAFLSLFVADIKETKAVDCSSPVWKNHSSCRDKETGSKKSTVRSSNNDLGGADLGGPNTMASPKLPSVVPSGKISGEEYKAYCGLPTEKCSVSFKNDFWLPVELDIRLRYQIVIKLILCFFIYYL